MFRVTRRLAEHPYGARILFVVGRRSSFDYRHHERLDVADGDVLTWIRLNLPVPPRVDAFRRASRGAIHPAEGLALLAAAGHPDAELRARLVPSFGHTHGLRLGFISGGRDPTP